MGFILKKIEKYMGPPLVPYDFFFLPFYSFQPFFLPQISVHRWAHVQSKTQPKSVVCKPKQIKKQRPKSNNQYSRPKRKKKLKNQIKDGPKEYLMSKSNPMSPISK